MKDSITAEVAVGLPVEHLGDIIKVIRHGILTDDVPEEVKDVISKWCDFLEGVRNKKSKEDRIRAGAIGWTWAEACSLLDRGIDPRGELIPRILEDGLKDLKGVE